VKFPLHKKITVVEVGPREGFQAEQEFISTANKIALVNALSQTGLTAIEVTSFVHPKAVPQHADAFEVMQGIQRVKGVRYRALVPNLVGLKRAVESGITDVDFVLSASDSHNRNNVKKTTEESLKEFALVADYSKNMGVDGIYVSLATSFGCPFEGKIAKDRVAVLAGKLMALGATQIILADTTGMANPAMVMELLEFLTKDLPISNLAAHFHNTRGAGLANVLSALSGGITTFEASVGGMGGCPFAPGATGNIATEDLVNMLEEMGIKTGVNLLDLIACATSAEKILGRKLQGQVIRPNHVGTSYGS